MKKMLMTLAAAFFAVSLLADTWTDPDTGITWTYTITGDGATIYNGGAVAITPAPSGGVTIPPTLGGKPVTAIGQSAFLSCGGLTSIDIPDTVTSIGNSAFANCVGLSDIYIPASVTSVHIWAFDGCSGLEWVYVEAGNANYKSVNGLLLTKDGTTLVQGIGGGVTIPDGVTTIGDSAFYGCDGLWSITIPSSVTTIENNAFGGCANLASVVIPSSVTSIGSNAFASCDGLSRVTLPQADVDDFDDLFNGYAGAGLKVVIADGVTSIPDGTFKGCDYIKSVLIPGSVTTIGQSAFEGCTALDCLSICSGVTTIKANAFKGCTELDYVTIPESVYEIGTKAFADCTKLEHAFLPYGNFNSKDTEVNDIFDGSPADYSKSVKIVTDVSVVAVGDVGLIYYRDSGSMRVGGGAGGLAVPKSATGDLIIPSVLDGKPTKYINTKAFKGCDGLERVVIPSSVTTIASDAFDDCTGLWYAVIPASFESSVPASLLSVGGLCAMDVTVTRADGILWTYAVDGSGNATLGDGYGAPAVPSATAGALTIPSLIDGHPVTAIGCSAFFGRSGITSVTIPSGLTEIGAFAFQKCKGLMSAAIPSGVTDIDLYAFEGCEALSGIVVPQSVTYCGDWAFQNCSRLEAAVMPEGLAVDATYHEVRVFESTPVLSRDAVDYRNVDVEVVDGRAWTYTVDGGGAIVGGGVYGLAIPYATAVGGIAIPATLGGYPVMAIGMEAFSSCDGLTDVAVPYGVTAIDSGAFDSCIGLATVNISSTVTDIHPYAFDYCSGLTAFSVADGNAAYSSRNGLLLSKDGKTLVKGVKGDVTIPDGVETIGDSAFYGSGLTSVAIPIGVTTIDEYAFGDCDFLAEVAIPSSVTTIGANAFDDCDLLAEVAIPSSVTTIGANAFDYTPLTTVHVEPGDADRVKGLLEGSGYTTTGITFVEDVPPTYTVTFDANGGSVSPATRLVTANMTVGELPVPTREEYTFKGWFTAEEGGEQVEAATVVTSDVTFFAQWTPNAIDPESLDPFYPGVLPCYKVLNPADIWDPFIVSPKAVTLKGALYYGCDVVGIVELKIGKLKDYQGKVSGSVTLFGGKKNTIKSQKCGFGDKLASSVNLDVKSVGSMKLAIGSVGGVNVFSGSLGKWHVQSANIGGDWNKSAVTVEVEVGDVSAFGSGVLAELLPTNEVAAVVGGKWKFAKAASVKFAKAKGATEKTLIVDTSKDKTNLSGIKLSYTPKTGMFKGSFKVYALQSGKVKKFTVNVNGAVVDGVGYGTATSKKPAVSWAVSVK